MVELEFIRTYAAPRQLVWDAWTDPDQLAQWWGPRGISTPRESIELDLRPGGRVRFDMVDDATGERYPNSGILREVEPPSRLVLQDDGFPDGSGRSTTTVTLTAVDAATTTLRVHIVADFTDSVRAGAEQGWGSMLDKLADLLADCPYVLDLEDVDRTQVATVGGKGASLGELIRIDGIQVPAGFCVTTHAYRRAMALDGSPAMPDDVAAAITDALVRLGAESACAVRSSATAEDLPTASFAGQHDTYLNVVGAAAILDDVRRCWASLLTERAVSYRRRSGIDDRRVEMAVVVQRMVAAQASGVLFTADPITGNRTVASVEAVPGLGEALVSGTVNADVHSVQDGAVVARTQRHERPVLTDAQVVELARLGRLIEAHLGSPQDIEWCLDDEGFHVVQSRPITTLFPIPAQDDAENRVYVSVGHQQMMTDPMKPLGLSLFQLTALPVMHEAGGRLFVEVTQRLASPSQRAGLVAVLGKGDPLIGDALQTIIERGFVPLAADEPPARPLPGQEPTSIETDPAIVADLIRRNEDSVAALRRDVRPLSGTALVDFILADIQELKRLLFEPLSSQAIMAGMQAAWWLNDHAQEWLGERNVADTLSQSVPGNVTAEMGLALLDVADVIRPHPEVVAFLEHVQDEGFLDELASVEGGPQARDAIRAYLDRYGMRCAGEIDITKPRWSERPTTLLPVLLGHVRSFEPGEGARRFEQGRLEALRKRDELLTRLRAQPDGAQRADETAQTIDRLWTFAGYREYPKYGIVSRYAVYKQALLEEAGRLVQAGVLEEPEDVFFLRLDELPGVLGTGQVDHELIRRRRDAFRTYRSLTPPRVLTSDGEGVAGAYRRDGVPDGTLVGIAVSAGTIEGRARVVVDMADADLAPGDILVTTFTDPSWTPLFVTIAGLVTEVGGLMTHGAVIAREYGLPAVVGVEQATRLIRDGQRIRVHGTEGYVEVLSEAE
jgi:pyruvate,water dikinase